MNEVHLIAEELKHIANNKRASYIFITAYIIEIQALNGMRIGELLAIQPENIDFKTKTYH